MLQKEGAVRISSGCAISGIIDKRGRRFDGNDIITSIALMHERSNGLGGGFAAYGIYPEYRDFYALHVFYQSDEAKAKAEDYITEHFVIETCGRIPTRKVKGITKAPHIWRYFVRANQAKLINAELTEDEFVAQCVISVNAKGYGAYVFSSGKNMGCFKALGYPEEVGEFYMLDTYKAYSWTAHGRFPTNTPGWWGGAHPFTILDWSVVHNGEISSYDANRRFIEMFGYHCILQTDTEVMAYLFDFLVRKQGLSLETAAHVVAAPMWDKIGRMNEEDKAYYTALRLAYSSALVSGPFSILLGYNGGMLALNDRSKLRSLIAAETEEKVYFSSEEASIRIICRNPDKIWSVDGGKPIIVDVRGKV